MFIIEIEFINRFLPSNHLTNIIRIFFANFLGGIQVHMTNQIDDPMPQLLYHLPNSLIIHDNRSMLNKVNKFIMASLTK